MPNNTSRTSGFSTTTLLLGAQIFRNLAPITLIFLLARLTDPETLGSYTLALAVSTPLFIFAQFGLRNVTLTLQPSASQKAFMNVQWITLLVAFVLTLMFAYFFTNSIFLLVFIAAFTKISDSFAELLSGLLQLYERSSFVFWSSALTAIITISSAAAALFLTSSLVVTMTAVAFSSLLATFLFMYIPAARLSRSLQLPLHTSGTSITPESTHRTMRRIAVAGLPLGAATAILTLVSTTPQYFIDTTWGSAETARFAILLYVYALADIIAAAVSQAWISHAKPFVSSLQQRDTLVFALKSATKWTLSFVPISVIGIIGCVFIIPVVFGSTYSITNSEIIPLFLSVLSLPYAHILSTTVTLKNYYKKNLLIASVSALISVTAAAVLIPLLGITGAFWALLASVLCRAIAALIILTKP